MKPNVVVIKATEEEDIKQHWDYSFDGVKTDIKSRRNMGMLNHGDDRYTVLELVNRNGDKGWLFGEADEIAFEFTTSLLDCFLIVPRLELVKYHEAHTKDIQVNSLGECVNKKYTGFNTKFVLTGVSLAELSGLPNSRIIHKAK